MGENRKKNGKNTGDRFAEFSYLTSNIARYIGRIKNDEMKKLGLKGTQVNCFFYLNESPNGVTLTELYSLCGEDKASVSRAVKVLTEKGYVERRPGEENKKYKIPLVLTDRGKEIASYIDGKIEEIINADGGCLTEEEISSFYVVLKKIYDHFKTLSAKRAGKEKKENL